MDQNHSRLVAMMIVDRFPRSTDEAIIVRAVREFFADRSLTERTDLVRCAKQAIRCRKSIHVSRVMNKA